MGLFEKLNLILPERVFQSQSPDISYYLEVGLFIVFFSFITWISPTQNITNIKDIVPDWQHDEIEVYQFNCMRFEVLICAVGDSCYVCEAPVHSEALVHHSGRYTGQRSWNCKTFLILFTEYLCILPSFLRNCQTFLSMCQI